MFAQLMLETFCHTQEEQSLSQGGEKKKKKDERNLFIKAN